MFEVAAADVLLVATEIGEGDGLGIEIVEEAFGAAAELDVGPASFRYGGHKEAIESGNESLFNRAEAVAGVVGSFDTFVLEPAAVELLVMLDEWGEGEFCESAAHGISRINPVSVG
jgi:hypothetical protein